MPGMYVSLPLVAPPSMIGTHPTPTPTVAGAGIGAGAGAVVGSAVGAVGAGVRTVFVGVGVGTATERTVGSPYSKLGENSMLECNPINSCPNPESRWHPIVIGETVWVLEFV